MKGYKVTDAKRTKRVGVACSNLQQLIEKGCKKLNIENKLLSKIVVQLEDGTIVEDESYFATLPQNTLLFLCSPGQTIVTMAGLIYDALKKINSEFLKAGELSSEFFTEDMKRKFIVLGDLVRKQENVSKRRKSKRDEDPEWFEGLETNATTKEQFMFRRSQDRVRGYFYKSCDEVKKSVEYKEELPVRLQLDRTMDAFRKKLVNVQYFGSYFDRTSKIGPKLCNDDGDFHCQGAWQKPNCNYSNHFINPYDSREARILFSTWNLDHKIERSRTVLPALLVAAEQACGKLGEINCDYFFELLFTTGNLKLVHIVCHDKGAHNLRCDTAAFTK